MNDWLPTAVVNWASALIAAAGWAVSSWSMVIAAVALMGVAAIVYRSARSSGRLERWRGIWRHDSPAAHSQ